MPKARTVTVVGSLVLHGLLAGAAVFYANTHKQRKAHSVAVMGEQKKKEAPQPKPEPPKPPPPRPRPAAKTPDVAPREAPPPPREAAPRPAAPKSTAPPVAPGEYSNSGGGGGGGKGGPPGPGGDGSGAGAGAPKAQPAARPQKLSEEDACTEAPSKPAPLQRATEIEYTDAARANGVEGRLVLKIIVGPDGAVVDVIVVSSVDAALDAAAIAAVKTWTFKPALRCGKPMGGGVYMLAQRFELGD